MNPLESEAIRKALTSARDGGFRSIKLRAGDSVFQATLSEEALTWGDTWTDDEGIASGPTVELVCSPVVGYVKWLPDVIKIGTEVKSGQTVGEVLALGISNEIVSPCSGKVVQVLVEDGSPVEYGKCLLEVEV
ncbi:MAG: acetyl-CoA carboxylase biotin carboxyl carrier protein [Fimbriimonadaceae bacterium]